MHHDLHARQFLAACDLQASAEFVHEVQLAALPTPARPLLSADAEAWVATQTGVDADPADSWFAPPGCDWLLAEGCEDCVRDLGRSVGGIAAPR